MCCTACTSAFDNVRNVYCLEILLLVQVLWSALQWKGEDVVEYGTLVPGFPGNVVRHPMLARLQAPHTATLVDGTVLHDVDAVIYCTGYQYCVPFLDDPEVVSTDGQRCVD